MSSKEEIQNKQILDQMLNESGLSESVLSSLNNLRIADGKGFISERIFAFAEAFSDYRLTTLTQENHRLTEWGNFYDIEGDLANAHLIAAAPELLEALQLLLHAYMRDASEDFYNKDVEEIAKSAINKALNKTDYE